MYYTNPVKWNVIKSSGLKTAFIKLPEESFQPYVNPPLNVRVCLGKNVLSSTVTDFMTVKTMCQDTDR